MANVVLLKIAVVFLVILLGWVSRRRGYLAEATMSVMSRFAVDIAFPALVFTQMLRSVDAGTLREGWYLPLLTVIIIVIAWLVGVATAPVFASAKERNTFIFCVAIPNWVFLPLPIADALYGADGVRVILLCNAGAQLVLWSLGVWILHAHLTPRQVLRHLATNPGLIATVAGIAVALAVPQSRTWESLRPSDAGILNLAAAAGVQGLALVGSLTIPLQLLVIGAQLGGLVTKIHKPSRAQIGLALARLVIAPAVTLALAFVALRCGVQWPESTRMCAYLIAAMPVSLSTALFTERYGGDIALGAQGIFLTTFLSLLSVPLLFYAVQRLGL